MIIKLTLNEVLDADVIALITPKIEDGLPASVAVKRTLREMAAIQDFAAATFASASPVTYQTTQRDSQCAQPVTHQDDSDGWGIDLDALEAME